MTAVFMHSKAYGKPNAVVTVES